MEHNVGNVPDVVPDGQVQRVEDSPGEIVRGIDENGCWMVLKNIERHPDYKGLLDESLDEVDESLGGRDGGMTQREGFIFLSAPGSTTPAHTDPEHNLLLQVRGTKDMTVGEFPDEDARQQELERQYRGEHRNIDWLPKNPETFHLEPGDSVYVPPHAPHLVKNGDTVSVSLSITFRTPAMERELGLRAVNSRLRGLGLKPKPPGQRPRVDRVKAALAGALGRAR